MTRSPRRISQDPSLFVLAVATALLALTALALLSVSGAVAPPCSEVVVASWAP